MKKWLTATAAAALVVLSSTANAAPIVCNVVTNNYMEVDDSQVSACVAAGVGNINGNPGTDDFLTGGGTALGYTDAGVTESFVQSGATGTWSLSGAADAIGFKFGTGNTADEWFIYDLVAGVTSGAYEFFGILAPGSDNAGRLSHVQAYNRDTPPGNVPEPGSLALLGLGLAALGLRRRRAS